MIRSIEIEVQIVVGIEVQQVLKSEISTDVTECSERGSNRRRMGGSAQDVKDIHIGNMYQDPGNRHGGFQ